MGQKRRLRLGSRVLGDGAAHPSQHRSDAGVGGGCRGRQHSGGHGGSHVHLPPFRWVPRQNSRPRTSLTPTPSAGRAAPPRPAAGAAAHSRHSTASGHWAGASRRNRPWGSSAGGRGAALGGRHWGRPISLHHKPRGPGRAPKGASSILGYRKLPGAPSLVWPRPDTFSWGTPSRDSLAVQEARVGMGREAGVPGWQPEHACTHVATWFS